MKVSTTAQMRAMDGAAINQFAIPELVLMENAGLAVMQVLHRLTTPAAVRWLVLCGAGNNGGDGLVVARHLYSLGADVRILQLGDPARYGEAAAANLAMVQALSIPWQRLETGDELQGALAACDWIVDGLFGTGISRPVEGLYAQAIRAINQAQKPIVSLDIPSGINGDTGQVMGVAVSAAATVTFGLPKAGNLLYPGYAHGGDLWASHIGFPPALWDDPALDMACNDPLILPERPLDGHKGTFGDTLFVAGAGAYYGAPYFASLAFLYAGGGYARLATPRSVAPVIAGRAAELVFMPQAETAEATLAASCGDTLLDVLAALDFAVIGPGASLNEETQTLLRRLVAEAPTPVLVDGDGLTAVSADPDVVRKRQRPTVLTPHLGELARLTGLSIGDIQADRLGVLRKAAADLQSVVVMKGAHSLVGLPDGAVYINMSGNAGMATAGSGDVLAGTIAAMYGLDLAFGEAVRMGVFVHGLAGDLAAARLGEDGITAQAILDALPQAVRLCRERDARLGQYTAPLVS